jgi:hypothetical protein
LAGLHLRCVWRRLLPVLPVLLLLLLCLLPLRLLPLRLLPLGPLPLRLLPLRPLPLLVCNQPPLLAHHHTMSCERTRAELP